MKSSTSGLPKHAGVMDDLVGRPTRFLAGQAGRFAAETAARRTVASAYDRAYPGSGRFAAKIFDLPDIVKDNPRAVRIGAIAAPLVLYATWVALRSRRRRQEGRGDTKEASVNKGLRDIVLARVAGMRSEKQACAGGFGKAAELFGIDSVLLEKRAARAAAARRLLSALKRGKSLLTGSHLKRLNKHRDVMAANFEKLKTGPYADAEIRYKGLYNSDPLRPHNMSGRLGDLDVSPRPPLDPTKLSIADYTESKRIRALLRPASDRLAMLEGRMRGLGAAVGSTASRILREARAVRLARVAAGTAGVAGVGGAGYGIYRAVLGSRRSDTQTGTSSRLTLRSGNRRN